MRYHLICNVSNSELGAFVVCNIASLLIQSLVVGRAQQPTNHCASTLVSLLFKPDEHVCLHISGKAQTITTEHNIKNTPNSIRTGGGQNSYFFLFFKYFSQLYCSNGISPVGNSGCLLRGKAGATEWRYPIHGACWVF